MKPLNDEGTDHLSSGRAAFNDIKDDLFNAVSKGTTWADKFRKKV